MNNIIKWFPLKNKISIKYVNNSKSIALQYYLYWIKLIITNNIEIISGKWDSHIKFRKSYSNILINLEPIILSLSKIVNCIFFLFKILLILVYFYYFFIFFMFLFIIKNKNVLKVTVIIWNLTPNNLKGLLRTTLAGL